MGRRGGLSAPRLRRRDPPDGVPTERAAAAAHQPRRGGGASRRAELDVEAQAPSSPPPDPASRTPDPTCGGPRRARRGGAGAELTAAGSGLASAGSKLGRQAPPARVSAWRRRTRPRRPRIWASPARAGERMESPGRRRRAEPNRYLPSGRRTRAAAPSFSIASPRPQR